MTWKTAYRSIYYDGAPEPADPNLFKESTALLIIDVQNTYFTRPDRASLSADEQRRYDAWNPFHERMREIVIPRTRELLGLFAGTGTNASSRASRAIPRRPRPIPVAKDAGLEQPIAT